MKRMSLPLSVLAIFLFAAASAGAQAAAPAGATGLCKDGTYTTAATKSGACRGHQGVKQWLAASTAAPAASTKAAPAAAPAASSTKAAAVPAPAAAASGPAPAGATGLCKDGTYTTAATKSGACRGHQGVKQWLAASTAPAAPAASAPAATKAAMPAPTPAPAAPVAAAPAPTAAPKAPSQRTTIATAAPGGGPGLVWLNTDSNVYHCSGSQYYGKTKQGSYMSEADAKAKGAHADHNRPCTK